MIGKKVELLIPSRFHDRHTGYRYQYNENPHPRPMGLGKELFAVRKGGVEFPVEISLCNYTNSKGKFAIAFINDISKRKEIEGSVLHLKEELANRKIQYGKD